MDALPEYVHAESPDCKAAGVPVTSVETFMSMNPKPEEDKKSVPASGDSSPDLGGPGTDLGTHGGTGADSGGTGAGTAAKAISIAGSLNI